jgi:hypothetical protein
MMIDIEIMIIVIALAVAFTAYLFSAAMLYAKAEGKRLAIQEMAREMLNASYWFSEDDPTQKALKIYAETALLNGWVDANKFRDEWRKQVDQENTQ